MTEPKEVMDIWGKLRDYIENVPILGQKETDPAHSFRHQLDEKRKRAEQFQDSIMHRDDPSEHILENINVHKHPHIKEQMYSNAMNHINTAYSLAHSGDQYGAKLHIELAESALHTASRFMDHDEYMQLEVKVMARIELFISER